MQHNRGQTCSRNEFLIRVDSQQRHAKGEMPFNHYISDCWFSTVKIHVSFCAASSRVHDQNMNRTCLRLLIVVYTLLHYQRQLSESCTIHFVLWCRINTYRQVSDFISTFSSYDECDPIENPSHHRTWTLISNQLNDFLILLPRTNYTSLENQCMWM